MLSCRLKFARKPRIERLEERLAFALFNVQAPLSFTGLNNNSCVVTADLNKDGFSDAVLTNFGTDYASGAGTPAFSPSPTSTPTVGPTW